MDNKEVLSRFDGAYGFINKMFWIAASIDSDDLRSFISDIEYPFEIFPEYEDDDEKLFFDWLIENGLYGFIAEINIPVPTNVVVENGEVKRYMSSKDYCEVKYIYSDSLEELTALALSKAKERFEVNTYKYRKAK